ncbi:hypothetical protein BH11PSE7_BH11PSE7_17650 [soil metagenome]
MQRCRAYLCRPSRMTFIRSFIHRRKAATGRSKVCRLALVQPCRDPLHAAVIGVVAQVKLEDLHRRFVLDHASAWRHQRLRHIASGEDLLPDALGEFVATVRGPATEPGEGLEEQVLAIAPQPVAMLRLHHLSVGNAGQQHVLRGLRHTKGLQPCRVSEQGQIALVCVQRVRLRVGRQHDGAREVGLAQHRTGGFSQREVGQAVVNQVDGPVPVPERTTVKPEVCRACDHCLDAVPLEQALKQQELRVEVLLRRVLVHDGNAAQRPFVAREPPLAAKHRHDVLLELIGCGRRRHESIDAGAARTLCPCQHGVEHRAAGVGVDLDKAEAVRGHVKVVPEEHTFCAAGIVLRDGRCRCQNFGAPGRQCNRGFDRPHHFSHAAHVPVRQEDGARCKEVGAALLDQLEQARLPDPGRQFLAQCRIVQADAEAFAVHHLHRDRAGRGASGRSHTGRWERVHESTLPSAQPCKYWLA